MVHAAEIHERVGDFEVVGSVMTFLKNVARHTSHVTRHTSHVIRHTSHVSRHLNPQCPLQQFPLSVPVVQISIRQTCEGRHTSHVTRHTSHVNFHTSHVTRHTSQVTRYRDSPGFWQAQSDRNQTAVCGLGFVVCGLGLVISCLWFRVCDFVFLV